MDSWLNSDTFRPQEHVCTSKIDQIRHCHICQLPLPFAIFGKSNNGKFWRTDKLLGSRSIRIQPGIHFWGLKSPQMKFRVLKRTFSISDVFISIFPSISELSLKQVPQAFGTIWGQSVTIQLNYGSVLRSWGGGRSEIKYHSNFWTT